jgi:hypothetical protein
MGIAVKRSSFWMSLATLLAVVSIVTACATSSSPSPASPPAGGKTTEPTTLPSSVAQPAATLASNYSDPFAYCVAMGNMDEPGAGYTGPKMPDSIAEALKIASGAAPDAPLDVFQNNSYWRCMDGKVYACFVGANLPCADKANTDQTPTPGEMDFCKANPNSDFIPAAVTGHDTVYEWRCKDGQAQVVRQTFQVDARGYIANIWYAINPP